MKLLIVLLINLNFVAFNPGPAGQMINQASPKNLFRPITSAKFFTVALATEKFSDFSPAVLLNWSVKFHPTDEQVSRDLRLIAFPILCKKRSQRHVGFRVLRPP